MAKLFFNFSTMNAGKTISLLSVDYNYRERDMRTLLFTSGADDRVGLGVIASRIGPSAPAVTYDASTNIEHYVDSLPADEMPNCILVDEAQFLTKEQAWQLADIVDRRNVPVMCYGIRTDFQGNLFPGSAALLAIADELREIKTICHCGRKATMVARFDPSGQVVTDGDQIQIGGNESYVSFCRLHWREATKREAAPSPIL